MICLKRNHGEANYLCDHYIFVFFRLYILHTSEHAPLHQGKRSAKMAESDRVVTERHCARAHGEEGGGGEV